MTQQISSWARHLGTAATMSLALASSQADRPAPGGNPAMVVLPGAQHVRTADAYDGQLGYRLPEPYPGRNAIQEVRRRLRDQGWRPRERDFLNPTLTYAITTNWREAEMPEGYILAWSEQWENARGDVVMYGFSYPAPGSGAEPASTVPMDVLISYFGADRVKSVRQ